MRASLLVILLGGLMVSACSMPKLGFPRVHKITIQQGNVITQEMVDQLKPGMTRNQVLFVMGDPVMRNPFNKDRWDYIYYIRIPDQLEDQKNLSLFFENDRLASFSGNFSPSDLEEAPAEVAPEHIIEDLPPEESDAEATAETAKTE